MDNIPFSAFFAIRVLGKPLIGRASPVVILRDTVVTAYSLETGICAVSSSNDALCIFLPTALKVISISWASAFESFSPIIKRGVKFEVVIFLRYSPKCRIF